MAESDGNLRVNYFNYFTEIEEHFVRRRGKYLLVSPLDWAALDGWKELRIPLHVVLKGIDRVFDAYERRSQRTKLINSILYCQQEVLNCFEEYKQAHIGKNPDDEDPAQAGAHGSAGQFSRDVLRRHIEDRERDLERLASTAPSDQSGYAEVLDRCCQRLQELSREIAESGPMDLESLEMELTRLENLMLDRLKSELSQEEIAKMREDGESQLRGYRKGMTKQLYEQTLDNFVSKQLRERYRLPRLSLFYL